MVSPGPRLDPGIRRIVLCGLSTLGAVVLLFSYRTSTGEEIPAAAGAADIAGAADGDATDGAATDGAWPTAAPAAADPPPRAAGAPPAADAPPAAGASRATGAGRAWSGTVTGPVVQVKWGQVQVRARITQGRIAAVDVLRTPDENAHDRQINAAAVPVLVRETLDAQSARIDMVSGATYTSGGYVQSLQAALDRAGGT